MLAGFRVQACICNAKPFDRTSSDDVFIDNLIDVCVGDMSVPNRLRIHNDGRSVFTLIEAAGLIGTDFSFEAALSEFLFE